jgi:DNA-binding NtrC family response regulator
MSDLQTRVATVLVVDDEPGICRALSVYLTSEGHRAITAGSGEEALRILGQERPNLALIDLRLPGMDGLDLLKRMKRARQDLEIVLITAFGGTDAAIQAAQAGAYAYLPKPFDLEEVGKIVRRTMARLPVSVLPADGPNLAPWDVVMSGPSDAAQRLRHQVESCARTPAPVVLFGEVGSGREAVARAIHAGSAASAESFRAVGCSALLSGEIGIALEGPERQAAGFCFLMEMGDLDPAGVEVVFERVEHGGASGPPHVAASLRAASPGRASATSAVRGTPAALVIETARRRAWSVIEVPALRTRLGDLGAIMSVLLGRINLDSQRKIRGIDASAVAALRRHPWPGNMRELENVIRTAATAARDDVILAEALPASVRRA